MLDRSGRFYERRWTYVSISLRLCPVADHISYESHGFACGFCEDSDNPRAAEVHIRTRNSLKSIA